MKYQVLKKGYDIVFVARVRMRNNDYWKTKKALGNLIKKIKK